MSIGLGKPNFHAAQDPQVRLSIGIELEDIRFQLSMQNLACVLKDKHTTCPAYADEIQVLGEDSGSEVKAVATAPATPPKKGKKDKTKAVVVAAVAEITPASSASTSTGTSGSTSTSKSVEVHCPVNFICSDIDVATTMVGDKQS